MNSFFENLRMSEKIIMLKDLEPDYLLMDYVFSDESKNFVIPCEPEIGEKVKIRLRGGRDNFSKAFIHFNNKSRELIFEKDSGCFSYFYIEIESIMEEIEYYFSIIKNGRTYYYNKKGLYPYIESHYNFKIIPGFKTPDWAKGAIMYQIFVDRFYNGDSKNDVVDNEYWYLSTTSKKIENWNQNVADYDICNFYGGDLQGVIDKMPYLKDLGIEVIYFNPIFVSPSNHKYDIQDYDYIDPHYGVIVEDGGEVLNKDRLSNRYATKYMKRTTNKENLEKSNKLFIKLVEIAHENGIKIILDGVFNHCGSYNKWMDKEGFYYNSGYDIGAYASKDSKYHDYFSWYADEWPNNDGYDSWWGHLNHPKLDFENSKELYGEIMDIARKWVSPPYNADGWRLDVAADLGKSKGFNHKFWQDFRKNVKEANPEAIIIAEHYGDPSEWLKGDQWDSIMNYDAFMEPLSWFLTGMEKHSYEYNEKLVSDAMTFEDSLRYNLSRLSIQSINTAMNQISNHDHSRFLTRTNQKVGRISNLGAGAAEEGIRKDILYEAVVFQMTWAGAPTIYYGDEAGLCGFTDPDNRRTYPWGKEDKELINFHKEMIRIRKENTSLRDGSVEYIYGHTGIVSFGRFDENNKIIVIINNNDKKTKLNIPVWKSEIETDGILEELIYTYDGSYKIREKEYKLIDGYLSINMEANSSIVLRAKE